MKRRCNIGILAHVDAGKTTVTEHLLHLGGLIRRPGSVDAGTTVTDWMVDEQERGITITSAASTFDWKGTAVTLVDTPGHVDFTIEVERTLRVLDGVVLVVSGPDGVQAQTETVWAQRSRERLPAIALINKLDGADFDLQALLEQLAERLQTLPVPLRAARRQPDGWTFLDLFEDEDGAPPRLRERWRFPGTGPNQVEVEVELEPADELDEVLRLEALDHFVDAVASSDDAYAELVLEGAQPTRAQHLAALAKATRERRVLPILFAAARHGLGIDHLADAIVELLPESSERDHEVFDGAAQRASLGELVVSTPEQSSSCLYVFKTEPRRDGVRLAFIRVFQGAVEPGQALVRTPDQAPLVPRGLAHVTGRDYDPAPRFERGEIGALLFGAGDPHPLTGDTLGASLLPFTIERLHPPDPVLEITVEAPDSASHAAMISALSQLCEDDPSLRLGTDRETGRALIAGMGELHLDVAIRRVERELGHPLVTGRPQIRQRYLLTGEGEGSAEVNHPAGRARVTLTVSATPSTTLAVSAPVLERVDWRGAVLSGLESAAGVDGTGPHPLLAGRLEARAIDLHGPDIVPIMLRDAAEWAALRALAAAGLVMAEPWVALEIIAPDATVGRIVGDLARRRARVRGSESRGAVQVLSAEAPLEDLIGYATDLRSMTAGRGQFALVQLGYRAKDA